MNRILTIFSLILFCFGCIVSCSSSRKLPSLCETLKIENCGNSKRSLGRSSGATSPTASSAAFSNPAAVSSVRGLGIESIHYNGEAQVGIVTGTGRIGAALSNFPSDGSFFGNTAVESINEHRRRLFTGERFKEEKLALSTGVNLFGGDKKKGIQLDLGAMVRHHKELGQNGFGGGLTLSYNKMISLGVAAYKDFYYKDLRGLTIDQYTNLGVVTPVTNDDTDIHIYKDELQVYTSSFTLKFSYFAFDNISFVTNFVDHDYAQEAWFAQVSSFSFFLGNWIFSVGGRSEINDKEVYIEGEFLPQEQKEYSFWGIQYASDTGLMFGVFYNYYLLDEISFGLTYFL